MNNTITMREVTLPLISKSEIDNTELLKPKKEPWHIVEPRIRDTLNIFPEDMVIGHGQEYYPVLYAQYIFRQDIQGMRWRTRPDINIISKKDDILYEEKNRHKSVEAIQLLFNKESQRPTYYIFYQAGPGGSPVIVNAKEIKWPEYVEVYDNHKPQFDNYLWPYLKKQVPSLKPLYKNCTLPKHIGSGDPFIRINISDYL